MNYQKGGIKDDEEKSFKIRIVKERDRKVYQSRYQDGKCV